MVQLFATDFLSGRKKTGHQSNNHLAQYTTSRGIYFIPPPKFYTPRQKKVNFIFLSPKSDHLPLFLYLVENSGENKVRVPNTMMTRSEFNIFLRETRSGCAQSNRKRKDASNPYISVQDLSLKRFSIDRLSNIETDVSDDAKRSRLGDVNVNVNVEQSVQISGEVKSENPDKSKLHTPLFPRSKLVENSCSVSFKRLLPYLKNLTEDESSGITICHSYDRSSNNEKILLQDVNILGGLDRIKAAEASDELNACTSLVNITGISSKLRSGLIGNLNSPSYKRLLPYLNDLVKDDSSNINTLKSQCNLVKADNNTEEIHFQSSNKQSHSVTTGNTMDNPVVDDKDLILEGNSSYSLEVCHEPINEELDDGKIDDISVNDQKTVNDLCRNDAESFEFFVNYNADIVQSTSPVANMLKDKDDFQTTPPNSDVINKLGGKYTDLASELNALEVTRVPVPVNNSTSKDNSSPVSCSGSKLNHNSNSFSYRRLLPYLTSVANTNTNTNTKTNILEVAHSQHPMTKSENGLREKSAPLSDILLTAEQDYTCSSRDHNLKAKHISEDLNYTSERNNRLCNNIDVEKITADVIFTESPDFEFEMVHKSSSLTPTTFYNLSLDELSGEAMGTNKEHFKQASTVKFGRNQALAPEKGILKKNSRRCKGMCMCSDCHLHRINAEKAFEFSRKQMSGANEVVEGLIKELSCLRKAMESSVVTTVNGADSYSALQADQKQLKCVCQRAHIVENQAKSYMKQMFSDLNNHCRSPGPRVTFSDTLEEKHSL